MGDAGVSGDPTPEQDFKLVLAHKVRSRFVFGSVACCILQCELYWRLAQQHIGDRRCLPCAAVLVWRRRPVAQREGEAAAGDPGHHFRKRRAVCLTPSLADVAQAALHSLAQTEQQLVPAALCKRFSCLLQFGQCCTR